MSVLPLIRPRLLSRVSHIFLVTAVVLAFNAQGSLSAQRIASRGAQFQPGQPLPFSPAGKAATEFQARQPRPLSMVSTDFDQDGVADLVIGYGLNKGGAIASMRGNLDALAPQNQRSWLDAGQGRYANPYLPKANLIFVPEHPDLLAVADLNGDGHKDLVFAARNGHSLYVLLGDGSGHFALQSPTALAGSVTALAAYQPGDERTSDALLVGLKTDSGSTLALYRTSDHELRKQTAYALPGTAKAIEIANLDADLTPDAAIVAGDQILILHGRNALTGSAQLETLPLNGVTAVTAGEFLFDRHAQLQLVVLTTDGTIHIFGHQGFDPRSYTQEEVRAARRDAVSLPLKAGNTGAQPWTEIENYPGAAPFDPSSSAPILLHSRVAGSGAEALVAVNASQQQITSIHHAAALNSTNSAVTQGQLATSPLNTSDVVAALSQRVSPQGLEGLVVLRQGSITPEIVTPASTNTLYVNTTADTSDTNDAARCTLGSLETCSLRDAVGYANLDSSINITDGTVDTIIVPAGTYNLTLNAGTLDVNGNAITHLDITGPMTIMGVAGTTIIDANHNDKIFSIDPNLNLAFNTTLENLTLQNGLDSNNPAVNANADNFGGALDWEAFGTGNLTITNCTIQNNKAMWGPGGGIFESNGPGGAGQLTITSSTISSNSTPEQGGGVSVGYGASIALSGTSIGSNVSKVSVNSSDLAKVGQGGGLFIFQRGTSATPRSTITGGNFISNASDSDGAGIYTNSGLAITGGVGFASNSSGGSGGAIFHNSANTGFAETTTISGSNFTSNSATTTGGAITAGEQTAATGNLLAVADSRFFGNTSSNGASGLSVGEPGGAGAGGVTAIENWWGCNAGPTTPSDGCDQAVLYNSGTGSLTTDPHVVLSFSASPNPDIINNALQLSAAVNTDSGGNPYAGGPGALQGLNIAFAVTAGAFSASPSAAIDASGNATQSVTPTSSGIGTAAATLDNQTVSVSLNVLANPVLPTITAAFSPSTIGVDGTSILTVTVTNPNPVALHNVSFSNVLPAGLTLITQTGGNCSTLATGGGSISISPGTGTFTSSSNVLAAGQSCNMSVSISGSMIGTFTDTTSTVTSTEAGPGGSASASLSVIQIATHFAISAPTTAAAGAAFNFTVTALDALNNVVLAYTGTAHFTSTDPAATLPADSTLINGVGTLSATLTTAGNQTVTATDTLHASVTGTSNTIAVSPAAPTHFAVTAPGTTVAGTAFSLTVTALDQFSNTTATYSGTVHFTSTDGSATLPADATLTGGVGTFSATLRVEGAQTITATDTATASITGTSPNIAVSAASGTHFVVTAPATASAGSAFALTVTAEDQFNNVVTGYGGTVQFSSSDGIATLPANSTLTNGVGTFSAALKTAGNQTIMATDTANSSLNGASSTITVSAAAAAHFALTAPPTATAGTSFNVTVTAQDQFNNTAPTYTGTVHFTSTDGTAVLPADSTLTNGVGIFAATLKTEGTQNISATDTVTPAITGTSNGIAVNPAASVHFAVAAPATATAGTAVNFTVTAEDQFDNLIAGYAGTIHFTSTDGAATLPANSTLANGVGTFSATFKTAGSQAINATDTVTSSITGVSSGIVVSAAAATHFTVSAPASAVSGTAFNFTLTALDQFNNTATSYTGIVHFTSPDGVATLPANSTLTNGIGVFSATLRTAGSQTLAATDTVTTTITGTSANIIVSAGPTAHFAVSAPASAVLGIPISFTVTAMDAANNVTPGYAGTVHFTSSDGAATLPADSTLASGAGAFSATLNTAGSQTIRATDTVTVTLSGVSNAIAVGKATPVITWTPGSSIGYGTTLSALLNATASFNSSPIAGTFTYTATPSGGSASAVTAATVLQAGTYVLTASFTPANTISYNTPPAVTNPLTVSMAALTATANSAARVYGAANPPFTGSVMGAVNGDTFAESFSTTATINSNVGTYNIVPGITGTDLSDYTVSYVKGVLTITQAGTTTALSVSNTSITPGQSVTLTAQVASATTGTPTGSVSFFDGSTLLATVPLSGGAAAYSTTSLSAGTSHALTATYSGDIDFLASSTTSSVIVTVAPLDFTMTISGPSSGTVFPGSTITYSVVVNPLYGNYAGPVGFVVNGLPSGATVTFSPSTIAANGGMQTVTVTIQVPALVASKSTPSPGRQLTHFALALLLLPLLGVRGIRGHARRLSGMVCLFIVLGGLAVTAALTGCGSSNGFFGQKPQSYNVTITANAGTVQHSVTVTLQVE